MILCPPHGDADRSELASTECCLGGCVIAVSLLSLVACGQHLTRGQKNAVVTYLLTGCGATTA